jgi:hypothetical protein
VVGQPSASCLRSHLDPVNARQSRLLDRCILGEQSTRLIAQEMAYAITLAGGFFVARVTAATDRRPDCFDGREGPKKGVAGGGSDD